MSSFISQETIEEVRQAADIVQIVSEHLSLKRLGTNYQAICPFHAEKTPSFSVNPQKQIFKCFGCGKAGNVFHFLMAIENISFPEAVKKLAERYGIFLGNNSDLHHQEEQKSLWDLMEWTSRFYKNQLSTHPQALEYLKKRNLSPSIIEQFMLGVAPLGWTTFSDEAKKAGFSQEALFKAGLILKSTKNPSVERYYDRFRNRIAFPIGNMEGKIIAFGGRAISSEDQPKYLNSPETILFSKSKTLYGWNFARNKILEERKLIVMEGYTDVLMAHQYGFTSAVATLGTSLTEEHVKIIKRYADSVVLLFDGDIAGQKAANRSIHFFVKEGIQVQIVVLPDNLDPCDFLVQRGKESFQEQLEKAEDFWDFQIRIISEHHDLKNPSGKRYAIQEIAKTIALLPDAVSKRLVLNRVGEIFKIPTEILETEINSFAKSSTASFVSKPEQIKQSLVEEDEKFLIWTMLHYPDKIESIFIRYPLKEFRIYSWKEMANQIYEYWIAYNTIHFASLLSRIEDPLAVQNLVHLYHANYGNLENEILEERLNLIFKGLEKQKYLLEFAKLGQALWNTQPAYQEDKTKILQNARHLCKNHVASQKDSI